MGGTGWRLAGPLALAAAIAACGPGSVADVEWRSYNGDARSTKYAPLDQIDRDNVGDLDIVWRRPSIDPQITAAHPDLTYSNNFPSTPLMIDGVLYSPNSVGLVEAFDAATGETVWVQRPMDDSPDAYRGATSRGVAYWRDAGDARVFVVRGEYLIALNATTGEPYGDFGSGGRVDLKVGLGPRVDGFSWNGAPLVVRDVVIVGSSMSDAPTARESHRGDVRAYDVRTGALRWTFHVVPQPGELGNDTWLDGSWEYTGHTNVWSMMSADEDLGYLYLPVTSPTNDMYGGHRPGANLFGQSLVCLDVETGARVWHFQTVHHPLWDYDPPAAPILVDITVDGRPIQAVVLLTKQSFAFVFDRVTGEPVWPIDERAVPAGDVPGEWYAPTQPFPTMPPPFDRQGVSLDDLIDFTPELRAEAIAIAQRYVFGPLFTPPSIRRDEAGGTLGTIQLPGSVGGPNWTGGAFDPDTGILYVPSVTGAFAADLVAGDPARTNLRYVAGSRMWVPGPQGLPLFKPPYGRITAIDLNRGEHVWMVANGDGPRDHPAIAHLDLPPLGNPGRAAPLLTRTLLFAGEGGGMVQASRIPPGMPESIVPGAADPVFRAYDKATGEVVWEQELPGGTTGAPMTYLHEGKQYIVVAIGAVDHPSEFVAFSLP